MSRKAKPSTMPTTPAEPSTAVTSAVAPSRSSAISTPMIRNAARTLRRMTVPRNGLRLSSRTMCRCRASQPPSQRITITTTMAVISSGMAATARAARSFSSSQVSCRRAPKSAARVSWFSTATTPSTAATTLVASWRASLSGTLPCSVATPACTAGVMARKVTLRDRRAVTSARMRSSSCCVARAACCTSLGLAAAGASDAVEAAARALSAPSSAAGSCARAGAAPIKAASSRANSVARRLGPDEKRKAEKGIARSCRKLWPAHVGRRRVTGARSSMAEGRGAGHARAPVAGPAPASGCVPLSGESRVSGSGGHPFSCTHSMNRSIAGTAALARSLLTTMATAIMRPDLPRT